MATIVSSAIRTCFGDGPATFAALLAGRTGVGSLRHADPQEVGVTRGYHEPAERADGGAAGRHRAGRRLTAVLREALDAAGVDPEREPVPVVVGTGLREMRELERWATDGDPIDPDRMHFGPAVAAVAPGLGPVLTVSNACSASGYALALAQDLVETGAAEHAVAAGTDVGTVSMLAMIGRVTPIPTERVRPFDADRTGVLLGDGAAAVVVGRDGDRPHRARLLATGLSCDAYHPTAPDEAGIIRAIEGAFARAGVTAADVDLVVAHGTGTAQNDPAEARVLRRVFDGVPAPLVTGVKGAVGHTSGAAALVNVDVAIRSMEHGRVPHVAGLETVLDDGEGLRLVRDRAEPGQVRLAQVNAFGFGGLNAVTLIAAAGIR